MAADFVTEIFPRCLATHRVQAHLFDGYWEDLGTIKSYSRGQPGAGGPNPPFDFCTPDGVIYTRMRDLPASRISGADVEQSLISDGCVMEGGTQVRALPDRHPQPNRP